MKTFKWKVISESIHLHYRPREFQGKQNNTISICNSINLIKKCLLIYRFSALQKGCVNNKPEVPSKRSALTRSNLEIASTELVLKSIHFEILGLFVSTYIPLIRLVFRGQLIKFQSEIISLE